MSEKILIKRFKDLENPENNIVDESKYITYRNKLEEVYKKSDDEFNDLFLKLDKITKSELSKEFKDTIEYLILIVRSKLDNMSDSIDLQDKIMYINKLENSLKSTINNLTEKTKRAKESRIDLGVSIFDLGIEDLQICDTCLNTSFDMLSICSDAKLKLKNNNNIRPPRVIRTNIRKMMAEELARALNEEGIKPTKYDEGTCNLCYKELLKLVDDSVVRTLPIVSKAIDNYTQTDKYPELNYI